LGALRARTGGRFLVAGEWLKQKPAIPVAGRSAAQVMDAMAKLSKRQWKRVGEIWVLAPKPKRSKKR